MSHVDPYTGRTDSQNKIKSKQESATGRCGKAVSAEKDISEDHDHMCSKSFLRESWSWWSSFFSWGSWRAKLRKTMTIHVPSLWGADLGHGCSLSLSQSTEAREGAPRFQWQPEKVSRSWGTDISEIVMDSVNSLPTLLTKSCPCPTYQVWPFSFPPRKPPNHQKSVPKTDVLELTRSGLSVKLRQKPRECRNFRAHPDFTTFKSLGSPFSVLWRDMQLILGNARHIPEQKIQDRARTWPVCGGCPASLASVPHHLGSSTARLCYSV